MPAISSGSRTRPNRCMVGGRLPRPEARAGPGAGRAALDAVDAVARPQLVLEVERDVLALLVLVADDVVRARHDASGAAGAQPGGDDLLVELLPLRRPAGRLRSGFGDGAGHGFGHGCNLFRWMPPRPPERTKIDRHGPDLSARGGGLPRRGAGLAGGQPARRLVRRGLRDERRRAEPLQREWPERLHAGGWICATWPEEYGGKGLTTMQGVVLGRGVRPGQGSDARRLLRRHARRADDPAVGDRGAEAGVPAQDPARRDALVPGLQRAELGLGSRQPEDVGRARRRRVGDQRAEGVDDGRTPRRLLLPPHPHRSRRAQAQGHLVPAGADAADRYRGARDHPARRHGGVLRGVLRRCPVPEGQRRRRREQRLEGRQLDARLRAGAVGDDRVPPVRGGVPAARRSGNWRTGRSATRTSASA